MAVSSHRMRCVIPKRFMLLACVAAVGSCADPRPEVVVEANQLPQKKPVKMPPTNRKLGSVESIAMDDFFAAQQTDKLLIYDVRVPYFYAIDHIPGALNWPYTEYDAQVQKRDIEIEEAIKAGKQVVLYCFHLGCPEARNVAKKLARRDYDVRVLSAGMDGWREIGLPVESGKAAQ